MRRGRRLKDVLEGEREGGLGGRVGVVEDAVEQVQWEVEQAAHPSPSGRA